MKSVLTVEEYQKWVSYFTYQEPDVPEIQMAVLSNMVAAGLGAKKTKIDNFLVRKNNIENYVRPGLKPMSDKDIMGVFSGFAKRMS